MLVESNPYVKRVYSFDKNINECLSDLKHENYDYIIDLHNNIRSHRVKLYLNRPSVSFNKLNIQKWLLVKFKINRLPDVHIVDRYLETVSRFGVINDNEGLDFFIPDKDLITIDHLSDLVNDPETISNLKGGFIAVVIGGNHNTKILPAAKVAEVCNNLSIPSILLGGKEDIDRGSLISDLTRGKAINLCGKLSLMHSACIVKESAAVLTNDTGLMHIAAAFNKPIASVWGNTVPDFGMYPYIKKDTPLMLAEVHGLKCRPCSKLGYKRCPLKHFNCMVKQDTTKISEFINSIEK